VRHICKEKTEFQCDTCKKYYKTKKNLNAHIKSNICLVNLPSTIEELQKLVIEQSEKLKEHTKKFKEQEEKLKEIEKKVSEGKKEEVEEIIKEYKKNKISTQLRYKIWNEHIGQEIGVYYCLCCLTTKISQQSFVCGHIIAEKNGGPLSVENLRPICPGCNSSMGTINMIEFQTSLFC